MTKLEHAIKIRLEDVLDEHFPKIEPEGSRKKANKRGAALMLYVFAMQEVHRLIAVFGGCEKCYGKSFSTGQSGIQFCSCSRGQQLEKLWKGRKVT